MPIILYTDGACSGNPGPGGWAALIMVGKKETMLKGGEPETTNNRMEMRAAIEGLRYIAEDLTMRHEIVKLHTDSKLVMDTITKNWKRLKNKDLWSELDEFLDELHVEWVKVRGHSTDKFNNKVDRVAVAESLKYLKNPSPALPLSREGADGFSCRQCGKDTDGRFSWTNPSLLRVDCLHCGKFIKFAPHTPENIRKAK